MAGARGPVSRFPWILTVEGGGVRPSHGSLTPHGAERSLRIGTISDPLGLRLVSCRPGLARFGSKPSNA